MAFPTPHLISTYAIKVISSATEMMSHGAYLAQNLPATLHTSGVIIFLNGGLGVGKTTLVRGFLQELGYHGHVISPTYTLIETYALSHVTVFHFDLYRLLSDDLPYIGFTDYLLPHSVCVIEWPEKCRAHLPTPDIECSIEMTAMLERSVMTRVRVQTPSL